jgi:hypothetical protein
VTAAPGYDELARRAAALGLALRGGFHPQPGDLGPDLAVPEPAATLVLLGFTGSLQWAAYAGSAEATDGGPDPLDRWSQRVVGMLAREFGARDYYPSGTPRLPFQRLGARCEPLHPSPIGLSIHPRFGLWHAYRGALLFATRIEVPPVAAAASPCEACAARPCLSACPVGAFRPGQYDVTACVRHVKSEQGRDCRDHGCRARRACPVGTEFSYSGAQARFHMRAFLRASG